MPKEYQVKVSDDLYAQKLEAEKLLVHCKHCNEDIDYRVIKKIQVLCTPSEQMLLMQTRKNVWICPLCQKENLTGKSEFIKAKLPNPYYLGVVPDPPRRKDGIEDRFVFIKKIEHWCWNMLGELEFAAAKFRDDSWQRAMNLGYDIISGDEDQDNT